MKREIKRLQRLRDIFRQNINNPAIVEQHRLVDARKRIETVSTYQFLQLFESGQSLEPVFVWLITLINVLLSQLDNSIDSAAQSFSSLNSIPAWR